MKRKKMVKGLMAEGITRNEADTFARVYRKLSAQKKNYLFPRPAGCTVPLAVQRTRYEVQKLSEVYRWEPYEHSVVGAAQAMAYTQKRVGRCIMEQIMNSGLITMEVEETASGYIEYRAKLLVATERESCCEYVEM